MAAEIIPYLNRATDSNNNPLSGAKFYFYVTGTTTPQSVYTDDTLATPHANPVVADSAGLFDPIYADTTKEYRGVLKTSDDATTILDIDPINSVILSQLVSTASGKGVDLVAGAGKTIATRTAMKALTSAADKARPLYLMEGVPALFGRMGTFVWDASDLSTEVAADTQEGIYVAPDSDDTGASGAWVRQFNGHVSVAMFGAAIDDITDDTTAFQAAIDHVESVGCGIVYMPAGTARVTSIDIPAGVILKGEGGIIGASVIRGTATTNPVVVVSGRSAGLEGIQVAATAARLASASPGVLAHGIHITRGDIAGSPTISRTHLVDVYVTNQPLDGVHVSGQVELSTWDNVTVADCYRHGFALDDGTRAGYTNKTLGFFVLQMRRCRAIECGGNALLAGKSTQTNQPSNLILDHFEALGCCWDTSAREILQQIGLYNISTYSVQVDIEDQQYANTTTASTSVTRTGNATPAEGILCAAGNQTFIQPYFSSLLQSIEANSSVNEITVKNPIIYLGTYNVAQTVGIQIQGGSTEFDFVGITQTGATKLFQTQSKIGSARINGIPVVPTTSSSFEGGIRNPWEPEAATISSGTLTVPSLNVVVGGEGAVADTLANFRYASGINGFSGHVLKLHYGSEDITISNGGNFLFKDGATSLTLDAAYPVATFVYNTATTKWVEQ